MRKIPNIFEYHEPPLHGITNKVRDECLWVFRADPLAVLATEKIDGTNVRLTIRSRQCVRVEKRRNPTKLQKAQLIVEPWYVDADPYDAADKHIFAAVEGTDLTRIHDGEHCAEAIGPKIQGNPLCIDKPTCVLFDLFPPEYCFLFRDSGDVGEVMKNLESVVSPGYYAEGIVFHNVLDGRRAKIRRKDFGFKNGRI